MNITLIKFVPTGTKGRNKTSPLLSVSSLFGSLAPAEAHFSLFILHCLPPCCFGHPHFHYLSGILHKAVFNIIILILLLQIWPNHLHRIVVSKTFILVCCNCCLLEIFVARIFAMGLPVYKHLGHPTSLLGSCRTGTK